MQFARTILVLLVPLCAWAALSSVAHAQDKISTSIDSITRNQRFGAYGHASLVLHRASFSSLPNVPSCCPEFSGPASIGGEVGVLAVTRLKDGLRGGVRVGLQFMSATFQDIESTTVLTPQETKGAFEHHLGTSMTTLRLMPMLQLELTPEFTVLGGLSLGWVIASAYDQRESIIEPDGAVFADTRTQVRNASSGAIEGANDIQAAVRLGIAYELPMNSGSTLMLAPECWYELNLVNYVQDRTWSSSSLRVGVSVNLDLVQPIKRRPVTR